MATFTHIPTLSLAQAKDPATKPAFLLSLREALLSVGFLYLSNTGLSPSLFEDVKRECRDFFETLPMEEKLKIEMKNEKSFLGYSRLGNEITAGASDYREQLDLSTTHPAIPVTAPVWHNLLGPNQWPSPTHLPTFQHTLDRYISEMGRLATTFTSLIAEALGLPATAFDRFFDADQQHKLKLLKYPDSDVAAQGVGAHKDSMLTSYLLQASDHAGLQAQNVRGEWIDCRPVDGTLVVAIGQGMESITGGVCASTTHRVLSPRRGEGARYSVPFFQGVSFDASFDSLEIPQDVRDLKAKITGEDGRRDDVEFTFVKGRWRTLGEATLMNRVKSHPDVSERWYPDLLAKIRQLQSEDAAARATQVSIAKTQKHRSLPVPQIASS